MLALPHYKGNRWIIFITSLLGSFMETLEAILEKAQQRAQELGLPYKGALLPMEAYRVLQEHAQAQLVDVRSRAELDWVGRIPGATEIELRSYPSMQPNPHFLDQLAQQVDKTLPVLVYLPQRRTLEPGRGDGDRHGFCRMLQHP
jgi:hypothetical protein